MFIPLAAQSTKSTESVFDDTLPFLGTALTAWNSSNGPVCRPRDAGSQARSDCSRHNEGIGHGGKPAFPNRFVAEVVVMLSAPVQRPSFRTRGEQSTRAVFSDTQPCWRCG
jgi:hypothetical protein